VGSACADVVGSCVAFIRGNASHGELSGRTRQPRGSYGSLPSSRRGRSIQGR
jgi:hypothetical protein